MIKYVSIGCNDSAGYMFALPLCVRFFHRVANYKPIAVLVADEAFWVTHPLRLHVLQTLNNMNGDCIIEFVGDLPDNYPKSSIAQSCRQHVVAMPWLRDSDLLMPGDADLIPLESSWHNQHNPDQFDIALYYCNGADPNYLESQHFPTCYTSMKVGIWREIMGIAPHGSIADAIRLTFTETGFHEKKGMDVWFQDQVHASNMIAQSRYYPARTMFIEREGHPPCTRIDRGGDKRGPNGEYIASTWPGDPDISGKIDAHLPRQAYSDFYWPSVRRLIEQAIPDEVEWADRYRERFVQIMGA